MKDNLKEIYRIFFPKNISEKYRHIGYSYPGVPQGWKTIVEDAIVLIEKEMWPQWYLPLFIKRLIHYLATGNSVVRVKYIFFYKLRSKLTRNQQVMDIKDKYATLRIYGYFNDRIDYIIDSADLLCQNTCEKCSSRDNVEIFGNHWIENLCKTCRSK
jgi:hypothetical protein